MNRYINQCRFTAGVVTFNHLCSSQVSRAVGGAVTTGVTHRRYPWRVDTPLFSFGKLLTDRSYGVEARRWRTEKWHLMVFARPSPERRKVASGSSDSHLHTNAHTSAQQSLPAASCAEAGCAGRGNSQSRRPARVVHAPHSASQQSTHLTIKFVEIGINLAGATLFVPFSCVSNGAGSWRRGVADAGCWLWGRSQKDR